MNRKILEKVKSALEENKLDYAKGLLDALIENLPEERTPFVPALQTNVPGYIPPYKVTAGSTPTTADDFVPLPRLNNVEMSAIETQ